MTRVSLSAEELTLLLQAISHVSEAEAFADDDALLERLWSKFNRALERDSSA